VPPGRMVAPWPGTTRGYRTGRSAARHDGAPGPPWEPAPEPEREISPLPAVPGPLPPEPGPGLRVPADMAVWAAEAADPSSSWDLAAPDGPPDDGPADGSGGFWHRGRP
jgi:hypothetical protein